MQSSFEARFNTYLPLLTNRENSCNFLTTLFNRIIYFFKTREWVNDQDILNKFQASIQNANDKTIEIYQIFLNRVGPCAILNKIKDQIFVKVVEVEPIIPASVVPVQSPVIIIDEEARSAMKMTHSRFHPELWYYARKTMMFGKNNLDVLLTAEGEKLSDKDKETLYTHLKNSQEHNTIEYRQILLSWMLDVEKNERSAFKTFLESALIRIGKGESQEQLMLDLRKIRTYLINHDPMLYNNSGKKKAGNSYYVYQPLLEILFPGKFSKNYRCGDKTKFSVKNGRIYIPKRISPNELDDKPHWAAGFVIGTNEHATAYIFDGTHYVWLDHNRNPLKLTAQKLYDSLMANSLRCSFDYFLIPETDEPKEFPNASQWIVPGWERNNCYVASSMALLAVVQFYENNLQVKTPSNPLTHSKFSSELWKYARDYRNSNSELPAQLLGEAGSTNPLLEAKIKECSENPSRTSKKSLYQYMLDAEKEERSRFRVFLNNFLSNIKSGISPDELKLEVRIIRKYLQNYAYLNQSDNDVGTSTDVFQPLLNILIPKYINTPVSYSTTKLNVKDNRLYSVDDLPSMDDDLAPEHPQWIAGIAIAHNGHSTTYIYDGSNYVWLDKDRKAILISAQDLCEHIKTIPVNQNRCFFIAPKDVNPKIYPDAKNWSVPGWERNNCFIASALILLTLVQYYKQTDEVFFEQCRQNKEITDWVKARQDEQDSLNA